MRKLTFIRAIVPALLLATAVLAGPSPASAQISVGISVHVGPPALPVYAQPPCPTEGYLWTPGYWGYNAEGGYFWVPGVWVAPPRVGLLWTPGYWGFAGGVYLFHAGYWGPHVGFYGGVNYGFGYGGAGFVGGRWEGGRFAYNTAVVNVNTTIIHNTYIDRTVVERDTVSNPRHVAFSGGPNGIRHEPTAGEQAAMRMHHTPATSYQTAHITAARADRASFAKANGGHPHTLVAARPLAGAREGSPARTPGA